MIKRLVLLILLSLSSLAALAVPTVTDVENTIVSGDYAKAKEQIREVLKVHPDSVVANKYMLEIIKIEYAGSLVPSVEFKIYEDKLKQIEVEKQKRLAAEKKAKEEKEKAEFWAGVKNFFKGVFYIVLGLVILSIIAYHGNKELTIRAERDRKAKWVEAANTRFVTIDSILSRNLKDPEEFRRTHGDHHLASAGLLLEDNTEASKAVENGLYDEAMINRHFANAFDFIDRRGLE